jgi:hypothetical protein
MLAKLGRNLEQPVPPREHHHDNVFGNRALVTERVAYRDPGRQCCELDQLDPGRDRLHQFDLRRRRIVGAPVVADQDFGIGRSLPQPCAVDRVVEDLDFETSRQPVPDACGSAGRHSAEEQRLHDPTLAPRGNPGSP